MKKIKIIGLTGQSGAGKSTVAQLFRQNGACVIDADKLVAQLYKSNSVCVEVLKSLFGDEVADSDGAINKKALAKIVFADSKKLELLNSVVHPFVMALFLDKVKQESKSGCSMLVYDAPQLFEANADVVCDIIVSVTATKSVRTQRICKRDNITSEQAMQRINAQFDEEFFVKNSDYIIENNCDLKSLETQFAKIFSELV